jgi:hypothetical protein
MRFDIGHPSVDKFLRSPSARDHELAPGPPSLLLNQARAANHYDMAGHGSKAEKHLHEAESEINPAIEAARAAK